VPRTASTDHANARGRATRCYIRRLILFVDWLCEHVVTRKTVRHSDPVPSSGSDTVCGRPRAVAASAITIATAAIASVLDICKMNFVASLDMRMRPDVSCLQAEIGFIVYEELPVTSSQRTPVTSRRLQTSGKEDLGTG
jgi:hypothetical protein